MRLAPAPHNLSYDDVLLVPQKGIVSHRKDVDLSTSLFAGYNAWFSDFIIQVPIVSAPMESVTGGKLAFEMYLAGGFGFIHRNTSIKDQAKELLQAPIATVGCALGVNEGYDRLKTMFAHDCVHFCIDIAHGHSVAMENYIANIPSDIRPHIFIAAGNVATGAGAMFLEELGVNAIKVGIGPGAACSTREVTGFGIPQYSAIVDCAGYVSKPIIADGGIRSSGDICKAIQAGASTVMVGSLLAGAHEAPHPGVYFGMASKQVNGHRAPEGVVGNVPIRGTTQDIVKELAWGIRSGVSYAGGTTLESLRNCNAVQVAPGVQQESAVRIDH